MCFLNLPGTLSPFLIIGVRAAGTALQAGIAVAVFNLYGVHFFSTADDHLSFAPRKHRVFSPVVMPRTLASSHVVAPFHFGGLSGLIEGL